MALTAARNTLAKSQGVLGSFPVKGSTKIYAGSMVMEVSGYAKPAADASGGKVLGRADQLADNTSVTDGAIKVRVQQGVFKWGNNAAGSDPVVAADVGKIVYVEDDYNVNHTGGTNHVIAGICMEIDADGGIWVNTAPNGGI